MLDDAIWFTDSHRIRRQVPNDHDCANLSATVVRYEILPGVSLNIVTGFMSNTPFKSPMD